MTKQLNSKLNNLDDYFNISCNFFYWLLLLLKKNRKKDFASFYSLKFHRYCQEGNISQPSAWC